VSKVEEVVKAAMADLRGQDKTNKKAVGKAEYTENKRLALARRVYSVWSGQVSQAFLEDLSAKPRKKSAETKTIKPGKLVKR